MYATILPCKNANYLPITNSRSALTMTKRLYTAEKVLEAVLEDLEALMNRSWKARTMNSLIWS